MRRRTLFSGIGALVVLGPSIVQAQSPQPRPVVVFFTTGTTAADLRAEVVAGIVENGLIEARDFDFAYRAGENDTGRVAELIAQIVAQQPAVIVSTTTGLAVALQKATNTIPIVNTTIGDPVGLGIGDEHCSPRR